MVAAALSNGGSSWTSVLVVWALLAAALPAAFIAVPNKPPRVFTGLIWLGMGLLVALQTLPLPRQVTAMLQPHAVELSDLGRAALGLPKAQFIALALAPGDAALQGAVYLLGATLTLLGSIALSGHDGRRAIHWAANVVIGTAIASGAAWVLAYTSPVTDFVPGSLSVRLGRLCFVNPNSEAALLNMGIALALSRMRVAINPRWQTLFGSLALFLALVVLEVGSRGGVITMGLVLTMTVFMRPRIAPGRRVDIRDLRKAAALRTGMLISAIALVAATIALPALEAEFAAHADSHKGTRMLEMMGMGAAREGAKSLLRDTWLAGAGPGGLPVLAGQDPVWGKTRADFAENYVIDSVLDFGAPIGLLLVGAVVFALIDLVRRRKDIPQAPGFIIGIAATLVANLVDFSLQLAGTLLPFMALTVACERALGPREGREGLEERRLPTFRRVLALAVLAVLVSGGLLARSLNAMSRNVEAVLQSEPPEVAKALTADRFLSEHHAFYLYGRALTAQRDFKNAALAFDRAVALRPDSAHARLFRFASHLELGDAQTAAADLRWLLDQDDDIVRRAMRLCVQSSAAEAVLIRVIPTGGDQSLRVADLIAAKHPDLVERVALALRKNQPNRVFAIEYARGHLYIERGNVEAARRIAANLLVRPETRDLGYMLEGHLLARDKKHYEAYHLFRDVCKRKPESWTACNGALMSIVAANRPDEAMTYLRIRAPYMQAEMSHAAVYWDAKGQVALQLNREEDALEAFRRAHGFAPDNLSVTLALASTCAKVGLRDEARTFVGEVLAKQPSNPTAKQMSIELERDLQQDVGTVRSKDVTPSLLDF